MTAHGTRTKYVEDKCRCDECRAANTAQAREWRERRRTIPGGVLLIDKTSTIRRVRALQALGWTLTHIAQEGGWCDGGSLMRLRSPKTGRVHVDTALRIAGVYRKLSGTPGPSERTRSYARRMGWAPPLAWNNINDPSEVPQGVDL